MTTLRVTPAAGQPLARATPPPGTPIVIVTDLARQSWKHAMHWGDQVQRTLTTPGALEDLQALVRTLATLLADRSRIIGTAAP